MSLISPARRRLSGLFKSERAFSLAFFIAKVKNSASWQAIANVILTIPIKGISVSISPVWKRFRFQHLNRRPRQPAAEVLARA